MDLEFHNHYDLADYFLDRYLQQTKDYDLLSLLSFYKSYRAYVRGKVSSFKINDEGISNAEREEAGRIARRYFAASERYADALFSKPKVIIFFGPPASGKTFLCEALRKRYEGIALRSDIIRKDLLNLPIDEHFFAPFKKGIYNEKTTQRTYSELRRRAIRYASHKMSTFLDATFSDARMRQRFRKAFSSKLLWVLCRASQKRILSRIKRERRYSDATVETYQKMKDKFRNLPEKNLVVANTDLPVKENIKKIEEALLHI